MKANDKLPRFDPDKFLEEETARWLQTANRFASEGQPVASQIARNISFLIRNGGKVDVQ
jgi:hypothetical protein